MREGNDVDNFDEIILKNLVVSVKEGDMEEHKEGSEKREGTRRICPACGGTGQVSFFQGESRFLLTTEECSLCLGLGYILMEKQEQAGGMQNI